MPWRDPENIGPYLMTVLGAGLYGLYMVAVRVQARQDITARDVQLVALNVVCAVACGLILTAVFATRIAVMIPWPSLRDSGLLAFAFGCFGWELLPLLFKNGKAWASRKADEIGGAQ